ncbi:MAG: aminopeptidase [Myxococcales bacterium]|nr:aminopeptidase [Myxococcales bacterium]
MSLAIVAMDALLTRWQAFSSSRSVWKKAGLILGMLPLLLDSGCFTVRYLGQQAAGQLHLLRIRRHVDDVLSDPATPEPLRERLQLALAARQFGIDELGLRGGAEFKRFVDTGGPVAYNLTAAPKTAWRILRWRFPLVGTVPYLGFFDRRDALVEAKKLEARGYDVYVRPVGAYSSLGYLISPIYASMLDQPGPEGEVQTVETILHEMAHSTAYLRSASELNESYATLVGVEGAARFFRERGASAQSALVHRLAQEEEQRHLAFSAWLEPALKDAAAFYRDAHDRHLPWSVIEAERAALFARLQASYRAAFPSGPRYRRLAEGPLNNAVLLSFGVYHRSSDFQQRLLAAVRGDLRAFVELYRQAERRSDGAAWLRSLVPEPATAPQPGPVTP